MGRPNAGNCVRATRDDIGKLYSAAGRKVRVCSSGRRKLTKANPTRESKSHPVRSQSYQRAE